MAVAVLVVSCIRRETSLAQGATKTIVVGNGDSGGNGG